MNLKEFMDYKTICPLCNNNLTFVMGRHYKGTGVHRYEDNRILIIRDMRGLFKGEKHYKVGYSIGLEDNSVQIEFYTERGEKFFSNVPSTLLPKFRKLDENIKAHIFMKECRSCHRYSYESNPFFAYLKAKTIGDLQVNNEYFGVVAPHKSELRVYRMYNNYLHKKTLIEIFNTDTIEFAFDQCYMNGVPGTSLNLDLIKFTSESEIAERLDNLIIFS
jgi:hypothetical protein